MSAVLEHEGHRRPGPLGVAVASDRPPMVGVERPELTGEELAELGDRLRASVGDRVRLPEPVLEVVLAMLLAAAATFVRLRARPREAT
jgi:hypothetical protein